MRKMSKLLFVLVQVLILILVPKASSFSISNSVRENIPHHSFPCTSMRSINDNISGADTNNDNDNDNDNDEGNIDPVPPVSVVAGKPKSRLTDYVTQFLDKTASEDKDDCVNDNDRTDADGTLEKISDATHLIAIPMDSSHELLIELESVQRAILHHCPILLDACISGVTTRLPLLYIHVPGASPDESPQKSASVTATLAKTVQRLVKKHIFDARDTTKIDENETEDDAYNSEGYRPISMTFQSLEIDGENNNVLNTVGSFMEGDYEGEKRYNERRFENLMRDLKDAISMQGWKTALPFDPHQTDSDNKNDVKSFRPRIAFMELPTSFDENISKFKNKDIKITEEDMKFLRAEEGGNGISPIFWCNWWDDIFARNVRLQEIGVYARSPGLNFAENAGLTANSQFYFPFETVALPNGNSVMLKTERNFSDYYKKRLEEEEEKLRKEQLQSEGVSASAQSSQESFNPLSSSTSSESTEPDIVMSKTRKRLESIYLNSEGDNISTIFEHVGTGTSSTFDTTQDYDDTIEIDSDDRKGKILSHKDDYMEDWMKERIMAVQGKQENNDGNIISEISPNSEKETDNIDTGKTLSEKDDGYVEDWMKEKIKKAINSMESSKYIDDEIKEPKFSIKDNPVFKAYKLKKKAKNDGAPIINQSSHLSRRSTKKDLGPYPSKHHFVGIWQVINNPINGGDSNSMDERSENLILRVDGTTAAGPTLNRDTKQKAAGGTWKIFVHKNGDVTLRIRLVVPPEKNRIVVMEGLVERGVSELGVNLASRNFGIPQLEAMEKEDDRRRQDFLSCSGEAHIEDAISKKNELKLDNFSLMKVRPALDPKDYTITVPKTIQRLD